MFSRAKTNPHSVTPEDMIATCGMGTQAWATGDTETLLGMCADDIIFTHNAANKHVPFYGTFKGKDSFKKWMEEFGPKNIEMKDIWFSEHNIATDNSITRSAFCKFVVKATDIEVETLVRHHFTFENGKFKTMTVIDDSHVIIAAFQGRSVGHTIPCHMLPGESKVGSEGDFIAQLGKASQAWKVGDMAALEAMISCDKFESIIGTPDNHSGVPFMGHFKGTDGFRQFIKGFESITIEAVHFHEHKVHRNVVTRLAEFSFTVNATNNKVTTQWSERFVFDAHGNMERMECIFDSEKVIEAFAAKQ